MPKIDTHDTLLWELLGKSLSDSELEDILPVAKAELDGHEDGILKIELNDTNRPDLWSAPGIARQLKTYWEEEIGPYDFFSSSEKSQESEGRSMVIDASAAVVRPYSIGFAAEGHPMSEEELEALIQSQEKLCHNFGQKRKTIAIGLYRSDLITYPVHYRGADPDTTKFVPLGMEEELSLREILTQHEKGKEFGHIVSDKPLFPYLHDDTGGTLSFPPVINSASIGAVEAGDENIFVELSGPGLDDLLLAASILACDMADMGWKILPVRVSFPHETAYGKEITVPYYFQKKSSATVAEIHQTLGDPLTHAEIVTALARMGIEAVCCDDGLISATVPAWRNDFLHAVDIVEDVMIGHGLENFAPEMPHDFTVGRLTKAEELARQVKTLMVGLGFQEMMYNYLGSRRKYIDNMRYPEEWCIFIANPMSENYEVLRPSILPSLLESESASAHSPYPHKIFEVGKIAFRDAKDPSGTVTRNALGFLASDRLMGYNDVGAMIATLAYYLHVEYTLAEVEDARFIEGRVAEIRVDGEAVGIFGEVHPAVLENWGSSMPTIACEIDLDLLRAHR